MSNHRFSLRPFRAHTSFTVPNRSRRGPRRGRIVHGQRSRRTGFEQLDARLCLSGISFAPAVDYAVGVQPSQVATGDFDGDGRLDLAVPNRFSNDVSVLLGNAAGGFVEAFGSPFPVGGTPTWVAVGDLNGDGNPDLAVANGADDTVSVLLGDGAADFSEAAGSPFSVGSSPVSVAVIDFNLDGNRDVATANIADDTVTILNGDGTGGFAESPFSPFPVGDQPSSLVAVDLDHTADADLAVANFGDDSVTVLLNDGTGNLVESSFSPFPVGTGPISVAFGDFNEDRNVDLAVANSGSDNATILLGPDRMALELI